MMQDARRAMGKANGVRLSKTGASLVWLLLTDQCFGKVRQSIRPTTQVCGELQ
jgi:hypothetical protein